MSDSLCVKNGTEHVWEYVGPDGTVFGSNACQVEGCRWFRAVEAPKKPGVRRAKRSRTSSTDDGPESLKSLLRF